MNSKLLRSVLAILGIAAIAAAAAQPAYTGNQRSPSPAEIQLVLAWMQYRGLGRDYERGLHDKLLEFEDNGKRRWAVVGFPASQRVGQLRPGDRRELVFEETLRPLALLLGQDQARPLRAAQTDFRAGQLRFEFAGRKYAPALQAPALNRSSFVAYPDAGLSELSLVYGDIANVNAKLRLKGLIRPGEYPDYRDFDGTVTLQTSTHVDLNPTTLRDCTLTLARADAGGAEGTLKCRRTKAASELVPNDVEFSARP